MAITDGSPVNAANTNAKLMSRTVDTSTTGKVDLLNVSNTNLIDIQRVLNEAILSLGVNNAALTDASADTYSSNNVVTDGDDRKVAVGKLDGEFDTSSGHDHDGVNSKQIDISDVLNATDLQASLLTYVDDAAYVAANGVAAPGDLYYNTTDDQIRFFDDSIPGWSPLGGVISMSREVPSGLVNGANVTYTTSFIPLSNEHTSVYLDGVMQDDTEVSISGNTITFTTAPANGQAIFAWLVHEGIVAAITPVPGARNAEYITLNSLDITNKSVSLSNAPSTASLTILDVIGGTSQHYGVDFTVSGTALSWSGLGLDGFLSISDVLRIIYDS